MCYIFFVLATFITQLTMLNMLIAIMGDTFDKITENREINATRSKLQLMSELVALLGAEDKVQCKETFLFVIRP